jgi:BirA family biotin operon repressor/biotin-[acetyl-CoA-carboxylase] ligase
LLVALADGMAQRVAQWRRGEGFAGIRADWLRRAAGLGQPIKVRLPEREFSGRFHGVDEAGRLQLEQADGVTTVTAGEVFGLDGR